MATPAAIHVVAGSSPVYAGRNPPSSGYPAWRQAMTQTNKIYEAGKRWDDGTDGYAAKLVFPEVTNGGGLYSGTDGTFSALIDGYGGAVYVPELGAHGIMVYGGTGEGTIQEQLAYWDITADNPAFGIFQQPSYALTSAEADARGTSWYYNPTEAAAVPSANQIPWSPGTGSPEAVWTPTWDRSFPVARAGWVIKGKGGVSELGNSRPTNFRYNYPLYIPPAFTGGANGAIVVNDRGWGGSFGGNSGPPLGVSATDWYLDAWPSGRRKYRIRILNVATKQWSVVGTVPEFVESYNNAAFPFGFVDPVLKRCYYTAYYAGSMSLYYADFTAGAGAVVMSAVTQLTELDGQSDISQSCSNADLFVGTSGALAGKKLYYYKNGNKGLGMIDVGLNTVYRLDVPNPPEPNAWWQFTVDQANAKVYITSRIGSGIVVTSFPIPNTPAVAASYVVTKTDLDVSGITFDSTTIGYQYGSRGAMLTSLGNVILFNQRNGRMLAFRPS